jgi:chromosome segregation ATPase
MPDAIEFQLLQEDVKRLKRSQHEAFELIVSMRREIDSLREERAQLRRALHETAYCLNSLDVAPSTMTKATADTIVQLNLGGFND